MAAWLRRAPPASGPVARRPTARSSLLLRLLRAARRSAPSVRAFLRSFDFASLSLVQTWRSIRRVLGQRHQSHFACSHDSYPALLATNVRRCFSAKQAVPFRASNAMSLSGCVLSTAGRTSIGTRVVRSLSARIHSFDIQVLLPSATGPLCPHYPQG